MVEFHDSDGKIITTKATNLNYVYYLLQDLYAIIVMPALLW